MILATIMSNLQKVVLKVMIQCKCGGSSCSNTVSFDVILGKPHPTIKPHNLSQILSLSDSWKLLFCRISTVVNVFSLFAFYRARDAHRKT